MPSAMFRALRQPRTAVLAVVCLLVYSICPASETPKQHSADGRRAGHHEAERLPRTSLPESLHSDDVVRFSELTSTEGLRLTINTVDLSHSDSVRLMCSVVDPFGRHVIDLGPGRGAHTVWNSIIERFGDSSISVDNIAVNEVHEHEAPPFSSVFVLDYSASMNNDITNVLLALDRSSTLLRPGKDDFSVVQFDHRVKTPLKNAVDGSALDSLTPFYTMGGMTAFYSAAQRGIRDVALSNKSRVAVLISDGVDNASLLSANDIIREARQAYARVFIIGLANADRESLHRIGKQTGARVYFPEHSSELLRIFAEIYRINTVYYTISFPRPAGMSKHRVEAALTLPDGRRISDSATYYTRPELILEGRSVVLARFSENRTSIDEPFEDEVRQVVAFLQQHPTQTVLIRAHTDTQGSHAINDRLSQARAAALAEYLVRRGVDRAQIAGIEGVGKRSPLYPDDINDIRLQHENRRAEVLFLKQTASVGDDGGTVAPRN